MAEYTCKHCRKRFFRRGTHPAVFCSRLCKSQASNARLATCEVCGKRFKTWGQRPGKFCTRKCKGIASRIPLKSCAVCRKVFKPRFGARDQPTCSRECGAQLRRNGTELHCDQCNAFFYAPKSRTLCARFCSRECADAWQYRNKTLHVCITCGKQFKWSLSRSKNNNIKYCSPICRDADPDRKNQLIQMNLLQQTHKEPTSIERIGYALLDELGVKYQRQSLLAGKFIVDAYLPTQHLVVQFDGDYWHGNTRMFLTLDSRQVRRKALDKSQDSYLRKCGIRVLRIWGSDLKRSLQSVKTSVRNAIRKEVAP